MKPFDENNSCKIFGQKIFACTLTGLAPREMDGRKLLMVDSRMVKRKDGRRRRTVNCSHKRSFSERLRPLLHVVYNGSHNPHLLDVPVGFGLTVVY